MLQQNHIIKLGCILILFLRENRKWKRFFGKLAI